MGTDAHDVIKTKEKREMKMKRYTVGFIAFVCLSLACLFGFQTAQLETTKRVSIIIDDLGNNLKGTNEVFALKAPITVAIMPLMRSSKADAIRAKKAGFEILLHLPMEFTRGKKEWLGPGAITTDMSNEEIKQQVREDLDSIPYVSGINNHMGSKATGDERVMRAVMEVVKERHLFFVDSATSSRSKVIQVAKELDVPYTKRNIFLDNINSTSAIHKQLRRLIQEGKQRGASIAIGHVGIQGLHTSGAIRAMLPILKKEGVQVVPVSSLLVKGEKTNRYQQAIE
jgi:polysaccharide deacetylase 2 family uncharacterized protein YibQ